MWMCILVKESNNTLCTGTSWWRNTVYGNVVDRVISEDANNCLSSISKCGSVLFLFYEWYEVCYYLSQRQCIRKRTPTRARTPRLGGIPWNSSFTSVYSPWSEDSRWYGGEVEYNSMSRILRKIHPQSFHYWSTDVWFQRRFRTSQPHFHFSYRLFHSREIQGCILLNPILHVIAF